MLNMKFKLKALAVAVGLVAATSANAVLNHPINGPIVAGDGNTYGSLVLNVWNATSKYSRDLGNINTWVTNNSNGTLTLSAFGNSSHSFFDGGGSNSLTSLFDTLFGAAGITGWNV